MNLRNSKSSVNSRLQNSIVQTHSNSLKIEKFKEFEKFNNLKNSMI